MSVYVSLHILVLCGSEYVSLLSITSLMDLDFW